VRLLLVTGPGGAGTTTAAAATAVLAATRGCKTLLVGAAGDTGSLPRALAAEPGELDCGLTVEQVAAAPELQRVLEAWGARLSPALTAAGISPPGPGEAPLLPGVAEAAILLALAGHAGGRFDLVVLDAGPLPAARRLLALPASVGWYLDRGLGPDRRVRSRAGRRGTASLYDAAAALAAGLGEAAHLLAGPDAAARLVVAPDAAALAALGEALPSLAVSGLRVDGVLVNRVVPAPAAGLAGDAWWAALTVEQSSRVRGVRERVAPVPVLTAPYVVPPPTGPSALLALAEELYGGDDPVPSPPAEPPGPWVEPCPQGYSWVLPLPWGKAGDVALRRRGDTLEVTVAGERRVLELPSALRRCTALGASVRGGRLAVRFEPDPGRWLHR